MPKSMEAQNRRNETLERKTKMLMLIKDQNGIITDLKKIISLIKVMTSNKDDCLKHIEECQYKLYLFLAPLDR